MPTTATRSIGRTWCSRSVEQVTTTALAWSPASLFYAATADDPESEQEQRRRFLAEAVRRAFGPPPPR
ncbi:hypothetical protein OOZ19_10855 [Saccharopolyspora sp. NFXS83]|uniref:hypothetical protein n=1 Tax=Saccharopolyspora sp. NFXS83 TaxID=2993560 RepID=UPI00224B12FC|nr:hypothetical protein [Saccharopolyspora sp. NFXS83]MCX2730741.1 hypothetical protein [Saccharopolyspora sp. NFXS83]